MQEAHGRSTFSGVMYNSLTGHSGLYKSAMIRPRSSSVTSDVSAYARTPTASREFTWGGERSLTSRKACAGEVV
jgi:hypothetical protein